MARGAALLHVRGELRAALQRHLLTQALVHEGHEVGGVVRHRFFIRC